MKEQREEGGCVMGVRVKKRKVVQKEKRKSYTGLKMSNSLAQSDLTIHCHEPYQG